MPAEAALTSPFGNGPQDAASPIPSDQSGVQAAAGAQVPKMDQAPAPAQAAAPSQPQATDFESGLQQFVKGGGAAVHNPFDEMDPSLPSGYTPISPRLRKTPQGGMEHLRNDGKWAAFGDKENEIAGTVMDGLNTFAIRTKEDLPRFVGAIAGTALAERLGLGPWAAAFMAGGSQAAAGAAADTVQGQPVTPGGVGTDLGIGAAASLIPAGVGKYLEGKAAKAGAEAAIEPLIAKGGAELQDRQAAEIAAAQAIGAKPGPSQTAQELAAVRRMGPEAQKLYQMQWGKAAQFKESFNNAVSRLMGNSEQDLGIDKPDFYKVIGNVLKATGETTSSLKGLAKEVSGDAVHDVDPVLSTMRDEIGKMLPKGATIFDDSGKINAQLLSDAANKYKTLFSGGSRELVNVYNELYNVARVGQGANEVGAMVNSTLADQLMEPVARQAESKIDQSLVQSAPRVTPGLTLEEMDAYRSAFGKRANFQGIQRDDINDAYARMHHVMSNHLDTKIIDVLKEKYPQEAAQLMGAKDFYSGIKETAEDLQMKVEHDPENAARALIDVKNPKQVKQLWSMLKPEQQQYLSGNYLNTLLDPTVDEVSGKMKVATAESAWNRVDPKVKEIMYGKDGIDQINQMINYAKGINLKAPGAYDPPTDGLMNKFLNLAHSQNPKGALNFISSLFSKNTKAQDYVTDKLSGVLMPTGADQVSAAKRQQWMNRASQAMVSRWTRYGVAPAVSADIETAHPNQAQMTPQSAP